MSVSGKDDVHTDSGATMPSSKHPPIPDVNVGDEVTKANLQFRVESSIGRMFTWQENYEENIHYHDWTLPMTFIVQARYYDEKEGRSC